MTQLIAASATSSDGVHLLLPLPPGLTEDSLELFEDAAARLRGLGREPDACRLSWKIGHALRRVGRAAEAITQEAA